MAWIGMDWADREHQVCLRVQGSWRVEYQALKQEPKAIHDWVGQLRLRFGGGKVAIAVEQSRGALLYALTAYDFLVLYPINPKAFCSYRKAFRLSGAKDDPSDAMLLLQFLGEHHAHLKAWEPEDEGTRTLRYLVEQRRKLVDEQTRYANRLISLLKEYFPQALHWFPSASHPRALKFLKRWPSLEKAQRARSRTLREFFRSTRCRRARAEQIVDEIGQATALTDDPAVLRVYPLAVRGLAVQMEGLRGAIEELEEEMEQVLKEHPDREVFESLPGAGAVYVPRLIAAYGTDRDRFDAYAMQCFSGIAPVTKKSGNSCWSHHRLVCPIFLKQTFHEFAKSSIPHSFWAKAYYEQQRARGAGHHEAIRSLAYKWIRIVTRCWKDRTPYSEEAHLKNLKNRQSPLIARIEQIQESAA